MSDEAITGVESAAEAGATDDPDLAIVTAAQLSVCSQIVPEALNLRLAAYKADPSLGRTAGHRDPKVRDLEAPHLRARPTVDEPTKKPAGARRNRTSKKSKETA